MQALARKHSLATQLDLLGDSVRERYAMTVHSPPDSLPPKTHYCLHSRSEPSLRVLITARERGAYACVAYTQRADGTVVVQPLHNLDERALRQRYPHAPLPPLVAGGK